MARRDERYQPRNTPCGHPKAHLAGYAGWMHSDDYAGFGVLARAGPVREVACLAHVRRKFFDVHAAQGSAIAAEALERIAALYTRSLNALVGTSPCGRASRITTTRPKTKASRKPRIPSGRTAIRTVEKMPTT